MGHGAHHSRRPSRVRWGRGGGTFHLWIGEMELPWVQAEPVEDVVSPANLPEFLERMQEMWSLRHGEEIVFS